MKSKKVILIAFSLIVCSLTAVKSVDAQAISSVYTGAAAQESSVYAQDVIIKKYRNYNGKRQYRRWNKTKGCWVDPKWIDVD